MPNTPTVTDQEVLNSQKGGGAAEGGPSAVGATNAGGSNSTSSHGIEKIAAPQGGRGQGQVTKNNNAHICFAPNLPAPKNSKTLKKRWKLAEKKAKKKTRRWKATALDFVFGMFGR